jgi:hypothetical protein
MTSEDGGTAPPDDRSGLAGKFYRGTIEKLFRGSRVGVVRSFTGREIPFEFLHVSMVGPLRSYDDLREGMPVGFDVGWTSNGLRVTVIRAGAGDEGPGVESFSVPEESEGDA